MTLAQKPPLSKSLFPKKGEEYGRGKTTEVFSSYSNVAVSSRRLE
jgi:hypothetical protein